MTDKKKTGREAVAAAVAGAEEVETPDTADAEAAETPDSFPDGAGPADAAKAQRQEAGNAGAQAADAGQSPSGRKKGGRIPPATVEFCSQQPQNDTGNARRLLAHFGEDLLNVREVGWHIWNGTHWEPEGGDEAMVRKAQDTAERIVLEAPLVGEATEDEAAAIEAGEGVLKIKPAERSEQERALLAARGEAMKAMRKRKGNRYGFAVSSGNAAKVNAMIAQALPHKTVAPEAMDADPLAFNVLNGTLRFVSEVDPECPDPDVIRLIWTVRLDEHSREDNLAKVAPVAYDPKATCPKWDEFLAYFQPDEAVRTFLRDFHGYGVTGLTGDQTLIFNYGTGANGKSTLTEAIWRLCGAYAHGLNAESVTGMSNRRGDQATPDFARLPGARLVRISELPRGEPLKESLVKMLTGGEPMLVRHLNKGFFEFRPVFKAAMSGNDKPDIRGVDEGIWRRVKMVPWPVRMPRADQRPFEDVQADFEAERPGILNWLIAGALAYLNGGMRLAVPKGVTAATDELREEQDPVGRFIKACTRGNTDAEVTARKLYDAYVWWCGENSLGRPFSEKRFAQIMAHTSIPKIEGRVRKYQGIELVGVPDDPPHPHDSKLI